MNCSPSQFTEKRNVTGKEKDVADLSKALPHICHHFIAPKWMFISGSGSHVKNHQKINELERYHLCSTNAQR